MKFHTRGATLTQYSQGLAVLQLHKNECAQGTVSCLKECVKAQNCEILTHALTFLVTQKWQKMQYAERSSAVLNNLS